MSSGRSALMRKCSASVRSYDSPWLTTIDLSPRSLICAASFSPTPPLSAKISHATGIGWRRDCRRFFQPPLKFVEPIVDVGRATDAIETQADNFDGYLSGFIEEPHVAFDAIGVGCLQVGVSP